MDHDDDYYCNIGRSVVMDEMQSVKVGSQRGYEQIEVLETQNNEHLYSTIL